MEHRLGLGAEERAPAPTECGPDVDVTRPAGGITSTAVWGDRAVDGPI